MDERKAGAGVGALKQLRRPGALGTTAGVDPFAIVGINGERTDRSRQISTWRPIHPRVASMRIAMIGGAVGVERVRGIHGHVRTISAEAEGPVSCGQTGTTNTGAVVL